MQLMLLWFIKTRKHSWKIPLVFSVRPYFGDWLFKFTCFLVITHEPKAGKQLSASDDIFSQQICIVVYVSDLLYLRTAFQSLLSTSNSFGIQTHGIYMHISAWTLCRIPQNWAFNKQGRIMADYWAHVVRYNHHLSSDLCRI